MSTQPSPAPVPTWPVHVIDPHIHQWNPWTTPRQVSGLAKLLRPLPRIPRAVGMLAPRADREFVGHPHHILRPYLPPDYLRDTGSLPVRAVVHVEAGWHGNDPFTSVEETRWVAALPFGQAGTPELGGIVVHADPRWPQVGEVLDAHLAASPLVRGVRHSLSHHDDAGVRSFEQDGAAVAGPAFLRGFAAVAERGLSFELWLYSHQLPMLPTLLAEYPETTFVLDHYATPVGLFGPRGGIRSDGQRRALLDRWHDDLARVADHRNVVAKHSGLGMPLLGGSPRRQLDVGSLSEVTDRVGPLVRHLHDCLGPDRTMWASNYPMDKPVLSLPATAQVVLDVLGADARPDQLFSGVATRTYRLDSGAR
jgi:predicted TIM-barrel fold metal-dependent hydrolase